MAEFDSKEAVEAARKEIKECKQCQEGGMMPGHFASRFCESNGRTWDPEKKQTVGYPHCSCDMCF